MIISHTLGGLGNQMFQYAAARALSLRVGEPLMLDVSGFADYRLHQGFELAKVFACPAEAASREQIQSLLGWRSCRPMRRLLLRPQLERLRGRHWVVEPHFQYWAGFEQLTGDVYLSGYWQSERYFLAQAPAIRREFTFRQPLEGRNLEIAGHMASCNAVSLHVRRGDYVHNPESSAVLGACTLEYYRRAVAQIAAVVDAPHFFIFSDDIPWVREHLPLEFPITYVDHNKGADSFRDMQLMSQCRHHIIANSSFSWWGAWLNPSGSKIVVAPRRWFANDLDCCDLVPEGWVRL